MPADLAELTTLTDDAQRRYRELVQMCELDPFLDPRLKDLFRDDTPMTTGALSDWLDILPQRLSLMRNDQRSPGLTHPHPSLLPAKTGVADAVDRPTLFKGLAAKWALESERFKWCARDGRLVPVRPKNQGSGERQSAAAKALAEASQGGVRKPRKRKKRAAPAAD